MFEKSESKLAKSEDLTKIVAQESGPLQVFANQFDVFFSASDEDDSFEMG